jgi:hypothetical protein
MTDFFQLVERHDARLRDKEHRKQERARAMPDPNLRNKVTAALERAEIVHRPQRRPRGELHQQMPKNEAGLLNTMPSGRPWEINVVGKHLVRYDQEGKPAQAYPLGSNHHVVIWEQTTPNKKGEYERSAEVVTTLEAVRRRDKKAPVIRKTRPGWRFLMALCKGDMVEMADGTVGVVSKFSAKANDGDAEIAVWKAEVAHQLGRFNSENPYVVARIQTKARLREIGARVVLTPLGRVVYREGPRE